jgi:DNA segregation ATPase FtsK/SpoIIIE, S-DNA-T family
MNHSDNDNAESYEITLTPGGRVADLKRHLNEIQLSLKASIANLSVLTERGLLRLDIGKSSRPVLNLFKAGSQVPASTGLSCYLGQSLLGKPVLVDLAEAPHIMIAGTTGSGKSTVIHSFIANLLMKEIDVFLFDPKEIEFNAYADCPGIALFSDYESIVSTFEALVGEMNERYASIKKGDKDLPYIVIIVDEFADIITQDSDRRFQNALQQLAQKSRAAHMHIILATQRPSVDVLNGSIKANFPTRIACRVASSTDSRVILDETGAERLYGKGDAIVKDGGRCTRFQAAYTTPQMTMDYLSALGLG